ncbi:MAG: hypothetical protein HQK77_21195 [Desulfobacterales bacterium]|nr:hypothetical protein [Desulfobacterales bacterium]
MSAAPRKPNTTMQNINHVVEREKTGLKDCNVLKMKSVMEPPFAILS